MFWSEQVKERGSCIQSTGAFYNFKVGKSLEVHCPSILAVPDPLEMIMMHPCTAERGESLVKWAGHNCLIILICNIGLPFVVYLLEIAKKWVKLLCIACCCYRLVAKSCLIHCNPMGCSLPGSSIHGISQTRILQWVAISFTRGSSWPRDQTCISCIAGGFFTIEPPGKPIYCTGRDR